MGFDRVSDAENLGVHVNKGYVFDNEIEFVLLHLYFEFEDGLVDQLSTFKQLGTVSVKMRVSRKN